MRELSFSSRSSRRVSIFELTSVFRPPSSLLGCSDIQFKPGGKPPYRLTIANAYIPPRNYTFDSSEFSWKIDLVSLRDLNHSPPSLLDLELIFSSFLRSREDILSSSRCSTRRDSRIPLDRAFFIARFSSRRVASSVVFEGSFELIPRPLSSLTPTFSLHVGGGGSTSCLASSGGGGAISTTVIAGVAVGALIVGALAALGALWGFNAWRKKVISNLEPFRTLSHLQLTRSFTQLSSNSTLSLSSPQSRKPTTSLLLTATPTSIEPILVDLDKELLLVACLSIRITLSTRRTAGSETTT